MDAAKTGERVRRSMAWFMPLFFSIGFCLDLERTRLGKLLVHCAFEMKFLCFLVFNLLHMCFAVSGNIITNLWVRIAFEFV